MSNIYEALEQAHQEETDSKIPFPYTPQAESNARKNIVLKPKVDRNGVPEIEAEMLSLNQSIDYLLPNTLEKTILITGPQGNEGVSTIVREFARVAATRLDKTVLIMDAAHKNPTQHLYFNIECGCGWKDVIGKGDPVDKACHLVGDANLFLSPISSQSANTSQPNNQPAAVGFLEQLNKRFHLVIIDSSPATTSPESVAISKYVDGVVLVVEAERTRWQVVEHVKSRIERNGGKVLGIVFNKKKRYIPEFVYEWLR